MVQWVRAQIRNFFETWVSRSAHIGRAMQIAFRVNLPEMGKLDITHRSNMAKILGWQGAVKENAVEGLADQAEAKLLSIIHNSQPHINMNLTVRKELTNIWKLLLKMNSVSTPARGSLQIRKKKKKKLLISTFLSTTQILTIDNHLKLSSVMWRGGT